MEEYLQWLLKGCEEYRYTSVISFFRSAKGEATLNEQDQICRDIIGIVEKLRQEAFKQD